MPSTYFSLGLRVALPTQEARSLTERAGAAPPCDIGAGAALLSGLLALCPRVRAGAAEIAFLPRPVLRDSLPLPLAGLSTTRNTDEEKHGGPYRSPASEVGALFLLRASGEAPFALYGLLSAGAARPLTGERLRVLCAALARIPSGAAFLWWACVPGSVGEMVLPRVWRELDHWGE